MCDSKSSISSLRDASLRPVPPSCASCSHPPAHLKRCFRVLYPLREPAACLPGALVAGSTLRKPESRAYLPTPPSSHTQTRIARSTHRSLRTHRTQSRSAEVAKVAFQREFRGLRKTRPL